MDFWANLFYSSADTTPPPIELKEMSKTLMFLFYSSSSAIRSPPWPKMVL
jgi:hypothetical protein